MARALALEKTLQQMAQDCGVDLPRLPALELVFPWMRIGEVSLHDDEEIDCWLGLKAEGEGVGQDVARARGLVGN